MTITWHAAMFLVWWVTSKPTQSETLNWTRLDTSAFNACYISGPWAKMEIDKLQRHSNKESEYSAGAMNVIQSATDIRLTSDVGLFIYSFTYSLNWSFAQSFIQLFICLFVYLTIITATRTRFNSLKGQGICQLNLSTLPLQPQSLAFNGSLDCFPRETGQKVELPPRLKFVPMLRRRGILSPLPYWSSLRFHLFIYISACRPLTR
jgi:hypothetical protein